MFRHDLGRSHNSEKLFIQVISRKGCATSCRLVIIERARITQNRAMAKTTSPFHYSISKVIKNLGVLLGNCNGFFQWHPVLSEVRCRCDFFSSSDLKKGKFVKSEIRKARMSEMRHIEMSLFASLSRWFMNTSIMSQRKFLAAFTWLTRLRLSYFCKFSMNSVISCSNKANHS